LYRDAEEDAVVIQTVASEHRARIDRPEVAELMQEVVEKGSVVVQV